MNHIFSMYWRNVPRSMVAGQYRVFKSMSRDITQIEATGVPHGRWIDSVIKNVEKDDNILLVDIDAIPLNNAIVGRAFEAAAGNRVFGVAQAANHVDNRSFIYAAPAYLCFKKSTWIATGSPSFMPNEQFDVGMLFGLEAQRAGIEIELIYPNHVLIPKWPLAGKGCLGIGTFYEEMSVFHLFESRRSRLSGHYQIFHQVVEWTVGHQEIDIICLDHRARSIDLCNVTYCDDTSRARER